MKHVRLLSLGMWVCLTLGCDSKVSEGKPTGATCPDDSTVTYEGFVAPFMESYCTRCHGSDVKAADRSGAPSDHNFDNLQGILNEIDHVAEAAAGGRDAVNSAMPPSGDKPSTEERTQLGEWIACQLENPASDDDHDHGADEASHDAGEEHGHDAGEQHALDAGEQHAHDAL